MDKDNVGVVTTGWEDITNFECAIRHGHDLALRQGLRGVPDPRDRAAAASLPARRSRSRTRSTARASARTRSPTLPVPGPFKFESVTPQAELRLARNDNYENPRTGKPANLDSVVFKWYGDPDAMIAGFRNGEIDIAFDLPGLRHPEGPGPRRPGRGDPGPRCTSSSARTGRRPTPSTPRSNTGGCSRNAGGPGPRHRLPVPLTRRSAQAIRYAIDKNEINTRLLGGNAQVANTNISPSAWFYADQTPATFDPDEGQADPRRRRLD